MKKILMLGIVASSFLFADISNNTQRQEQQSESQRTQEQRGTTQSDTKSIIQNRGDEQSINRSLSKTLSETRSATQSVSKSKNGNWSITLNPVPYILMQLRSSGWDERAFFLRNSDIGTSFYIDEDEYIIDMNKKAYTEAKASTRGKMEFSQIAKLKEVITLLNYTGAVADQAISHINKFNEPDATNIENMARKALTQALKEVKKQSINIYNCNYGGSNDVYVCNNGEYTLALGQAGVPSLLKNGVPFYSAERIGFSTPSLTLSFATSTSEAMSKLIQDSQTRAVAQAIREYTSHLKSSGQSEVATKIENAFVEKALSTNVSNTASATITAINSGSPTSVLKIFQ